MESSTRTEELEGAPVPAPPDVVAARHIAATEPLATVADGAIVADGAGAADVATTEARPSLVTSIREQCSACGVVMAADQRYCVECGHRRGPARVASLDGIAQRAREAASAGGPPRRTRPSVNSTLIAGIGTLLLAMGVGVLIGRSGNGTSAKAPPAQVVTIAGGSGTAGTASTSTATQQPSASATKAPKSRGGSNLAGAKGAAKAPPPKAVKVGTPGKGPGYQRGHFTGNFFGPETEGK